MAWIPRPNKNAPTDVYFDSDMWIECNGIVTCKSGRFEGQFCSDLSDRVLVGAGRLGQLLDLKDASLPDHAHSHTHGGSQHVEVQYRTGPERVAKTHSYPPYFHSSSAKREAAGVHNHDIDEEANFTIDFSKMNASEAFISRIKNPKISKSTAENDLYSPHLRVKFIFKCY